MKCQNCNSSVNKDDKYCFNCGTKIEVIEQIEPVDNKNSQPISFWLGLLAIILFWIPAISIALGIISIVLECCHKKENSNRMSALVPGIIAIILSFIFSIIILVLFLFSYVNDDEYDDEYDYDWFDIRDNYNNDDRASNYL
jgi:ABC-type microcin C transport system permease subunit YejB